MPHFTPERLPLLRGFLYDKLSTLMSFACVGYAYVYNDPMRTKVGDRIRINFYFDKQLFDAMRQLATIKNTTYSELIRNASREYIVREGKKAMDEARAVTEIGK